MARHTGHRPAAGLRATLAAGVVAALLGAGPGVAGGGTLAFDEAAEAARAATAACREDGHAVASAVVDRSGNLLALVRDEHAGPHTVESSRDKAYTAASLGRPTQFYAELVAEEPSLHALHYLGESILLLGGGLPIKLAGEVVGGIGVGGAPGIELDEACARAGLDVLGAERYD